MKLLKVMALVCVCGIAALSGCVSKGELDRFRALEKKDAELELHKPPMAELMNHIQAHHSRLWFAGQAANWDLAGHELAKIKTEFDRVAKLYDKWEDVPKPLSMMIPLVTHAEFDRLTAAIKAEDQTQFTSGFERLTKDCNTCHRATKRDFILIQTPTAPGYTNLIYRTE
jgi:hypothetical protein